MSGVIIASPLPIASITANHGAGAANLRRPDPKEIYVAADATDVVLSIDLGGIVEFDTLFLGFTNAPVTATVAVKVGVAGYDETVALAAQPFAGSRRQRPRRHWIGQLPAPVTARYVRLTIASGEVLQAGVAAVGKGFRPTFPQERGSGAAVIDTGSRERLLSGGFGIDEGVRKGAWQFTLGDLTDDEVDMLYDLLLEVGETGTILVVERPDAPASLNERTHWSVFDRLDFYERQISGKHSWALKVEDWA